jgi:DNA-binding beta-propeller fold protein YncE
MKYNILFFIIAVLLIGCKKDEPIKNNNASSYQNGILVLNEGLFQQNNATLSWVNFESKEVTNQVFLSENNRPLGDTGNDMAIYGGKLYIVVNSSSTIEVVDVKTLKSIKQISMQYNGQDQQPRFIKFNGNKAYVTSYDGYINVLDTSSLSIIQRIKVGANPEGLDIHGGQLFVANSGGLSFPDVDSTVYKIDLETNTVTDTFVVGDNPGDVVIDSESDIYVVKRGDYGQSSPSELMRVNSNGTVINLSIPASFITKKGEFLYISYYDYDNGEGTVSLFNMSTESIMSNSIIDGSAIETLYGVYPSEIGTIYAHDAMSFTNSGYIRSFNSSGVLTESFNVGLNPTKIIFYE